MLLCGINWAHFEVLAWATQVPGTVIKLVNDGNGLPWCNTAPNCTSILNTYHSYSTPEELLLVYWYTRFVINRSTIRPASFTSLPEVSTQKRETKSFKFSPQNVQHWAGKKVKPHSWLWRGDFIVTWACVCVSVCRCVCVRDREVVWEGTIITLPLKWLKSSFRDVEIETFLWLIFTLEHVYQAKYKSLSVAFIPCSE